MAWAYFAILDAWNLMDKYIDFLTCSSQLVDYIDRLRYFASYGRYNQALCTSLSLQSNQV